MKNTTNEFLKTLDSVNLRYSIAQEGRGNEDDIIKISSTAKNMPSMEITFFVDEESVVGRVFHIATVPVHRKGELFAEINKIHGEYRWLRFYVDEDNVLTADVDAIISAETAGSVCFELMYKIYKIIDECYPRIMRTLW